MGFKKYERRRKLKSKGYQVSMEQKIKKNSRKRGPYFCYTDDDRSERSKIERFFAWIQSFTCAHVMGKRIKYRRDRTESIFNAFVIISFTFYMI